MNFGEWLATVRSVRQESELHAHVPEERSHFFRSIDAMAAELESLTLLNALVYAYKPSLVLETGTGRGFGTLAIASALAANDYGYLHTVEFDPVSSGRAKHLLQELRHPSLSFASFHCMDSREFIVRWSGRPFDFAFFDSDLSCRHIEFCMLADRELLLPGAICVFHDTSRLRGKTLSDYNPELTEFLDWVSKQTQWMELEYSRGLRVLRFRSQLA